MRSIIGVIFLITILAFTELSYGASSVSTAAFAAEQSNNASRYSVGGHAFDGFEKCKVSNELAGIIKNLISTGSPQKKDKTAWTYAVQAEVFGLPANAILIGVCDTSGERGCGWGNFLALVIARPLDEAKTHLKKRTGVDFTTEEREQEYSVTLRPVLAKGRNLKESILFCDPGSL